MPPTTRTRVGAWARPSQRDFSPLELASPSAAATVAIIRPAATAVASIARSIPAVAAEPAAAATRSTSGKPAAGAGVGANKLNMGSPAGGGSRRRPANRAGQQPSRNSNLYNKPQNRGRTADRAARNEASSQLGANRRGGGSNNVFADRNGDVHRRTNSGWESRQGNNWSRDGGSSNYGSRGGGNREYQ